MTNLIGFARGGGAKAAPRASGKADGGIVGAVASALGGGGNCGTGASNGKRGFQPGNRCGGAGNRNAGVLAKQKAHTAAKNVAKKHLKAGTALSKEGRSAIKAAAAAHRELHAARVAHKASQAETRNAKRRESRAAAKATADPKPATTKHADPKAEARATLDAAHAQAADHASGKAAIEARVAKSAGETSAIKADRATQHLHDLKAGAARGEHDGEHILARVDQIAKGATKPELFAAAKAGGVDAKGIRTKQDLVARIKDHVDRQRPAPAPKTEPAQSAAATKPPPGPAAKPANGLANVPAGKTRERQVQAQILAAVKAPGKHGVTSTRGAGLLDVGSIRDHVERAVPGASAADFDRAFRALQAKGTLAGTDVSDRRKLDARLYDRGIPSLGSVTAYAASNKGPHTQRNQLRREARNRP